MKKNDEGFTLIELLIVIVILGILAAVVVFAVGGITDEGQNSSCKAELKTVEVAIESYRAQEGTYPAAGATGMATLTGGEFLRSTPTWYTLSTARGSTAYNGTTGSSACSAVSPT